MIIINALSASINHLFKIIGNPLILDIGEDWGGGAVGVFVDVELHHSVARLVAVAYDVGGFSLSR